MKSLGGDYIRVPRFHGRWAVPCKDESSALRLIDLLERKANKTFQLVETLWLPESQDVLVLSNTDLEMATSPAASNLALLSIEDVERRDKIQVAFYAQQDKLDFETGLEHLPEPKVRYGNTLFTQLAGDGNVKYLERLLADKAHPVTLAQLNEATHTGYTPLMLAAQMGYASIVTCLLEKGVDVNTQGTRNHVTALMLAAGAGHAGVVKQLIEAGADLESKSNLRHTALMVAARSGQPDVIDVLAQAGAQLENKDNMGWTALMLAARANKQKAVEQLIKAGADIEATDHNGSNSLMCASRSGAPLAVKSLLAAGASVDTKSTRQWTALMMAAEHSFLEIVKDLLKAGADVYLKNRHRLDALRISQKMEKESRRFYDGHPGFTGEAESLATFQKIQRLLQQRMTETAQPSWWQKLNIPGLKKGFKKA